MRLRHRLRSPNASIGSVRKMAVLASASLLCAVLLVVSAADPAPAKKGKSQNPLAGRWTGMTGPSRSWSGPPAPISFQITNAGYVVNLTTSATLERPGNPVECSSAPPASVSIPPVRLNKPVPGYPKGKRFDYAGPGVQPPGQLEVLGKVLTARKMEGSFFLYQVQVTPDLKCGTGGVEYTVTRARG